MAGWTHNPSVVGSSPTRPTSSLTSENSALIKAAVNFGMAPPGRSCARRRHVSASPTLDSRSARTGLGESVRKETRGCTGEQVASVTPGRLSPTR